MPLPSFGWEMYHPPLFYLLASLFPNLRLIQFFNFCLVLAFSIALFFFLGKKYQNYQFGLIGVVFSLSLPVIVYSLPLVNNEILLFSLVCSGLIFYYFQQDNLTKKNIFFLGVLAGLSLLTKYTGAVFLLAVFLDILQKNFSRLFWVGKKISLIFLTAFVFSGGIYFRNFLFYGTPFISNFDLFPRKQVPPFRSLRFLTDFSPFGKKDFYNSRYYSFWGGVFFSFFHDEHNVFIPSNQIGKTSPYLLVMPFGELLVIFLGLFLTFFRKKDRIFLWYFFLLLLSFIFYCFRYPDNSSVKGSYLLTAILPLTVFGLNFFQKFRVGAFWVLGYLLVYFWLVKETFWL